MTNDTPYRSASRDLVQNGMHGIQGAKPNRSGSVHSDKLTTSGPPLGDLLEDVSSFSIQAYDEDNAALAATLTGAACDPIRRIELDLTLQRTGVSTSLRTKLFVRSTMSGGGT